MPNPLAGNALTTRADLQAAVRALSEPLIPHFSGGSARVRLGYGSFGRRGWLREARRRGLSWAHRLPFGPAKRVVDCYDRAAELESFARPLWGLAPLAAGGGEFAGWEHYRRGLANGADPRHTEYWGAARDNDQRLVEMGAIGFALALAPGEIWDPLDARARQALTRWLLQINQRAMPHNNWLFFRVLVNLGLARAGAEHDPAAMRTALDQLESFYLGDGWYADGRGGLRDYYLAFALHFYSLIYAGLARESDPVRAERFRERAALFADDYLNWFAPDGAALPYGRSLTYRFAQGSFWGALAFAGVEALPWPVIKGMAIRHLHYWAGRPMFTPDSILANGYGYSQLELAEKYTAPGSPYWALKFFLPLALPETHPFWQAQAAPQPGLPPVQSLPHAAMIVCRDPASAHVFAMAGGQPAAWVRNGAAKYAKFAYSSHFGFSVPGGGSGLAQAAADSMLALSEDGLRYRVRAAPLSQAAKVFGPRFQ